MFGADTKQSSSAVQQITKVPTVTPAPRPLRTAPVSVATSPTTIESSSIASKVVLKTPSAPSSIPTPQVSVPAKLNVQGQPTTMEAPTQQPQINFPKTTTSIAPADRLPTYNIPSDTHAESTPITDADVAFHELVRTPNQYNDALPPVIETIRSPITDQPLRPAPQDMPFVQPSTAMIPKGIQPGTVLPSVLAPEVLQPNHVFQPLLMLPEKSIETDHMPSDSGEKQVPGSDYAPPVSEIQTQLAPAPSNDYETKLATAPSYETEFATDPSYETVFTPAPVTSAVTPGIQASFAPVLPIIPGAESMVASNMPMVPLIATMSWPSPAKPEPMRHDDYAASQPVPYNAGSIQNPTTPQPAAMTQQSVTKPAPVVEQKTSWLPILALAAGIGTVAYLVIKE